MNIKLLVGAIVTAAARVSYYLATLDENYHSQPNDDLNLRSISVSQGSVPVERRGVHDKIVICANLNEVIKTVFISNYF